MYTFVVEFDTFLIIVWYIFVHYVYIFVYFCTFLGIAYCLLEEAVDMLRNEPSKHKVNHPLFSRLAMGLWPTSGQPQGNIMPYIGPYLISILVNIKYLLILIAFLNGLVNPIPYSLLAIPYWLFPIGYSLLMIQFDLFVLGRSGLRSYGGRYHAV